jgi:ADP-ribose pyrophosphatase YjhB (NUDIX family)
MRSSKGVCGWAPCRTAAKYSNPAVRTRATRDRTSRRGLASDLVGRRCQSLTRKRFAHSQPGAHAGRCGRFAPRPRLCLRLGGTLGAKIRASLTYYRDLADRDGCEIRLHNTTLYASVFRYDDQLLAKQELGETPSQCAIRETLEETGVLVQITGIVGIYSDPGHIVAYTDGEVRQEYEVTLLARPVSGTPAANDEASEAGWFHPDKLADLDIHPTMRRQIDDYLAGRAPRVD